MLTTQQAFEKIRKFSNSHVQWKLSRVSDRAQFVKKIAQALRDQKEILAHKATDEMGKPISQSLAEVEKCAVALETIADLSVENLHEKTIQAHYKSTLIRPEPYGLVFSIQPWNFPYWQAFRMAACAWMAGNLVVLKHSEEVAGCAELIEKICFVDGKQLLLNLKISHDVAAEVIRSPLIQMVTFTGSTAGGKKVSEVAGSALKKCVLELGGSDAYLVLPDCDLELAVKTCVQARMINTGQSCIAGKRFFVHEQIFNQFKKRFQETLETYKIGDPFQAETQVGPLAASRFLKALNEQVKRAQDLGAELQWTTHSLPEKGNFTRLGILDFGSNLKAFDTEEIFAPVASLYRFTKWEEVIPILNEGPFGLGGGVFTKDMQIAQKISEQMQVGTFVINSFVQSDPRVPFGGVKESGLGREMGLEGLHDFVSWKVIGQA